MYTDIIKDKLNHPIVLEAIVIDLTTVLDFYNVFQNLKPPMMNKLPLLNDFKNFNIVNTMFDDIIVESEFSTEMIRIYNNILSNKLDNDDIDINNNKLNINNLNQCTWKSRKRKCNNKVSDISNIQETSIINSSFKQLKKQPN